MFQNADKYHESTHQMELFDTHCVYFGEILPDEFNYRA